MHPQPQQPYQQGPVYMPPKRKWPIMPLIAIIVGPLALIILLAVVAISVASRQTARTIYLVNGLKDPYTAVLNGQSVLLKPGEKHPVAIKSSIIEVSVDDEHFRLDRETHKLNPGFNPLADRQTIVVNPDRLALIIEEETEYSYTPDENYVNPQEYFTNKVFHEFNNIDYFFEKFPDELMDFSIGSVKKRRIDLIGESDPGNRLYEVMLRFEDEELEEYARRILEHYPGDDAALIMMGLNMEKEEYLRFLQPYLAERPVNISAHLRYQNTVRYGDLDVDIEKEYSDLLAADPGNCELMYLLAMATEDPLRSNQMMLRAAQGAKPSVFAQHEVAWRLLYRGKFQEAFPYIKAAYAMKPDAADYRNLYLEVCLASGDIEEALRICRLKLDEENAYLYDNATLAVVLHAYADQPDEAQRLINEVIFPWQVKEFDKEEAHYARQVLRSLVPYGQGRIREYLRLYAEAEDVEYDYDYLMETGKLQEAYDLMIDWEVDSSSLLLLYCVAWKNNDVIVGKDALRTGIEYLEYEGDPYIRLAGMFRNATPPELDEVMEMEMWPSEKRIVFAALGVRFSEIRSEAFQLSSQMNYSPLFPHFLLKEITEGRPQNP